MDASPENRTSLLRSWDFASLVLALAFLGIAVLSLPDYGISYDESTRWIGGMSKLEYYEDVLAGRPADPTHQGEADYYPGLFDMSVAAAARMLGVAQAEISHAVNLLFGGLALLGAWVTARTLGGPTVAFFAFALLLLTPRFYGHLFMNPKDVPFAAAYIWACFACIRAIPSLPSLSWRTSATLGVAIGLLLSVRLGGVLFFGYLGLLYTWSLAAWATSPRHSDFNPRKFAGLLGSLGLRTVAIAATAIAILCIFWPYAHQNPPGRILEGLTVINQYPWPGHILYHGEIMRATEAPWHLLPTWLAITLPPTLLLPLASCIALVLANARSIASTWRKPKTCSILFLCFTACFPVLYIVVKNATVYGGIRHVLFIIPPLAVLASLSMVETYRRMRNPRIRLALTALVVALAVKTTATMSLLHPYQYTYFNEIVGGLSQATGKFDTEYWCTSYPEAIENIAVIAHTLGIQSPTLSFQPPPPHVEMLIPKGWSMGSYPDSDFHIISTHFGRVYLGDTRPVSAVIRDGAIFCVVVMPPK